MLKKEIGKTWLVDCETTIFIGRITDCSNRLVRLYEARLINGASGYGCGDLLRNGVEGNMNFSGIVYGHDDIILPLHQVRFMAEWNHPLPEPT